ncbi:hypothetical protein ACFPPD_14385 [Cohnella suwonensis]|uniref:Uncharacterized protein n=1 Tax=Cohnella suwonensis TaxID=696072 RepID=A0ABW0LVM1_9BACL
MKIIIGSALALVIVLGLTFSIQGISNKKANTSNQKQVVVNINKETPPPTPKRVIVVPEEIDMHF